MQTNDSLLYNNSMNAPPPSNVPPTRSARDVPLVIKDGLREIRFNTKQNTKRLMQGMQDTLSHIPKLGTPLKAATKTASQLMQFADHAAVDLLSTENTFRRADFRLLPCDFYVNSLDDAIASKLFIKNHYWALKHLLKLKKNTDFFVLEESVFQAFFYFRKMQTADASLLGANTLHPVKASESSLLSARVIYALCSSKPLSHHKDATQDPVVFAESSVTLSLRACVSVVLASEIASFYPNASAPVETLEALKYADEICGARLERWKTAILHKDPVQQLALELDFSIRHL
jgi:hypothetical protein